MKFTNVSKVVVLGLAVLLASSAFAGTKASLSLTSPATVGGTTLKPGNYKLEWDGSGPSVEVNVMQGKTVLAKVPGKLVDLSQAAQNNAAIVRNNSNGTKDLTGARFEGKKFALELGESGEMHSGSAK